jgi:putative restriction endonuclease
MNELQMRLLQAQYSNPDRSVTAPELARLANVSSYSVVNLNYGKLGYLFCEATGLEAAEDKGGTVRWWTVWSIGYSTHEGFLWEMHSEVAEALEILRWVTDEVDSMGIFREGAVRQVSVNAYERDPKARQKCLDYYGLNCSVCNFNFGKVYGRLGEGFIHVHHLRPISEIAEEYEVDPVKDLRPVCPNCHAMIHRTPRPYSIEEMKDIIEGQP